MYAIVETGGKQYKVEPGSTILVEKLPADQGSNVELDRVVCIADGERITVGQPLVEGAKVVATVLEHGKGKKIIVFKYKSKTRYRRKTGHRQPYSKLAIRQIVGGEKGD